MKREKTSFRKGARPGKKTEGKKRPGKTKDKISQDCGGREGDFPIVGITETKRVQEKAEEGHRLLEALMEYIPEGITIADAPDVTVRMVSTYGRKLIGRRKEEIEGIPVQMHSERWQVFHIDGITKAHNEELPLTRAVLQGEVVRDEEFILQRSDGVKISILCNAGPIRDATGNITGGVVAWQDITDLKASQEALKRYSEEMELMVEQRAAELARANEVLRENEELLSSIFSTTRVLFAYMDKDFNFLRVNRAYAEADGLPPEYFVGKNHFDLYPHEEDEAIFRRVVETGEPYFAFEKPFAYPEDPERGVTYWDWSLLPIKDSDEKVEAVLLSLVNVTQRKQAQKAQEASEARYRALFVNSKDPVYVVTRDGTFVDFNQAMVDLFGYSREELMDKNIRDLYVNPNERPRFQRLIERRGSLRDYEIRFRRKNGRVRECLIAASVWRAEDGTILGYQGIIRDVTRQRRYRRILQNYAERLRVTSQKLLDAQENERRLIARDLHDRIGGSLSAIKFSLARKLNQMNEGGSTGEILLENIISMVQRTIDENRRIMTELRPSLLDDLGLVETIDWFCGEFEGLYPHIRIEKQVEIEESEVPEHLKIVTFRICQEALNNIAKHSGGNLACICLTRGDSSLELAITDNGQGFDTKRLVTQEVRGGIGVVGMRERVELSGGTFSIKSKPGEGTAIRAKWEIKNNEE